jgi:hypothetical protein
LAKTGLKIHVNLYRYIETSRKKLHLARSEGDFRAFGKSLEFKVQKPTDNQNGLVPGCRAIGTEYREIVVFAVVPG